MVDPGGAALLWQDLDDVEAMTLAAERGGRAVVIGGGLLGLEAAYGLSKRGMGATVIHLMDVLMERQLDESAGFLLREALKARGVKLTPPQPVKRGRPPKESE